MKFLETVWPIANVTTTLGTSS